MLGRERLAVHRVREQGRMILVDAGASGIDPPNGATVPSFSLIGSSPSNQTCLAYAFIVGFGGGTTTRILADTDLSEIRVVELEPAIVEAGHFVKDGPVSARRTCAYISPSTMPETCSSWRTGSTT